MNLIATSPSSSLLSSAIANQYEQLREAAFGQALQPSARSSLMLFMRRGMWGWAQTITAAGALFDQQRCPPAPAPAARPAVVHVLAAIAMSVYERRAP